MIMGNPIFTSDEYLDMYLCFDCNLIDSKSLKLFTIVRPNIQLYMADILLESKIFGVRSIYWAWSGYIASDEYLQIFFMAKVAQLFTFVVNIVEMNNIC
jgi:hypothetical protein